MSEKAKDLFRNSVGYRMIFVNDIDLPLDLGLIPRFQYPKMSGPQRGFAQRNLRNIVRKMNDEYYFAFFFINNIAKTSNMPHIYEGEVSSSIIQRLHDIYQEFLKSDHDENFEMLKDHPSYAMPNLVEKNGKTSIVNGVVNGELSILSVMRYHADIEEVDLSELSREKGLLSKRSYRILKQALRLEDQYAYSKKVLNVIRNL